MHLNAGRAPPPDPTTPYLTLKRLAQTQEIWRLLMLQSNILQTERMQPLFNSPHDEEATGGVRQIIEFATGLLKRQYVVIIFCTLLTVALAVFYLKTATPTYTAQVKILLSNQKSAFVQQQSPIAETAIDSVQIETQLQILKSKAVATSVIEKLKLYEDPDFKPSTRVHSFFRKLRSWLSMPQPEERADQAATMDDLVLAFGERLTAFRVGISNVIELNYSASTAERAAEIVNAVADSYIRDQLNAKFEANKNATAWLQDRLRQLGQQALNAERAVSAFRSEHNIVINDGKLIDDQQIAELSSRLVAARTLSSDILARLNKFDDIIRSIAPDSLSLDGIDAPGAEVLSNPIINGLRLQYLDYARREADWSSRFGKNHLAVINLRNRMRDIRTSIVDELRHLAESSRNDYEVAKQKQKQIEDQLASAVSRARTSNSAELTMRDLETSAKSYRNLYESFVQRYMGAVQQETFPSSDARVIVSASPPPAKSKPKSALVLTMGLAAGLGLGIGFGLLRDLMDRVFRTSPQLESTLQLPCLSLVPLLKDVAPPTAERLPSPVNEARAISRRSATYWAATTMPLSRFTESIRAIKLAIDLNQSPSANKVVGITSSLPNEGKSTIAAALAQIIAHSGKRVILVDCDLRNPSLSINLAPTATSGLIETISGARQLDETKWHDKSTGLALLPVAKKGPLFHTSELLSAEPTRAIFDKLRASYDYVIVDLPPLAPIVDVRATTPLVDCFVLVVEWGRTKIDVVQHALRTAPNVSEAILGAVLNKTDMNILNRYDSYHSDYYNPQHYGRYGYVDPDK